jgi:hypothetical protein
MQGRQALDDAGDLFVGDLHIPMPALAALGYQARLDEPVQVLGGRRSGNPGMGGELSRGPRPAVEQREAERSPRRIGHRGGEPRELSATRVLHPASLPP